MSIQHLHDRGYKRLFSNITFFRQLLESFVKEDWVKQLDFDSCEKLDKSYVSDKYKESTSDLLYKVKIAGQEAYICILLEFQSTSPYYMAVRIAHYLLDFYLGLFEADKKLRTVPPVFPIVIYNGEGNWTAPTELKELINNYELLGKFAPDFRYFTIIEKDYPKQELEQIGNLVSTLFLVDGHYDIKKVIQALAKLVETEDPEDIETLMTWVMFLVTGKKLTEQDYEQLKQACQSKKGVITMLEHVIANEKQQYFAEGIEEGEARGIVKGKAERNREIALKLLADKVDINIIVNATSLSVDEIMELSDKKDS
jgi:predicted transposase/invertase (TIGR01784 family)